MVGGDGVAVVSLLAVPHPSQGMIKKDSTFYIYYSRKFLLFENKDVSKKMGSIGAMRIGPESVLCDD